MSSKSSAAQLEKFPLAGKVPANRIGRQGPKVRVNAVLPGLLKTEWVSEFSPFLSFERSNESLGSLEWAWHANNCGNRESSTLQMPLRQWKRRPTCKEM